MPVRQMANSESNRILPSWTSSSHSHQARSCGIMMTFSRYYLREVHSGISQPPSRGLSREATHYTSDYLDNQERLQELFHKSHPNLLWRPIIPTLSTTIPPKTRDQNAVLMNWSVYIHLHDPLAGSHISPAVQHYIRARWAESPRCHQGCGPRFR